MIGDSPAVVRKMEPKFITGHAHEAHHELGSLRNREVEMSYWMMAVSSRKFDRDALFKP